MTKDPFKQVRQEIDDARLDHRREIDEALAQIQAAISFAPAVMRGARIEFRSKLVLARSRVQTNTRAEHRRRRKRPRRDRGGEPAPVEPKPKPNLLSGGAEAPIE
jgi:hypothetical protein